MPFEPLGTDEKAPQSAYPRGRAATALESELLSGCFVIAIGSAATMGLAAWPFAMPNLHLWSGYQSAWLLGLLPSLAVGTALVLTAGTAGATGLIGGSLCAEIFILVQLARVNLGREPQNTDLPRPEWGEGIMALTPALHLGSAAAICAAGFLIRAAIRSAKRRRASR
jgi:hypothetical protein